MSDVDKLYAHIGRLYVLLGNEREARLEEANRFKSQCEKQHDELRAKYEHEFEQLKMRGREVNG